jgi:DNA-directed RNA polymerase subunit RPC12/RpoP
MATRLSWMCAMAVEKRNDVKVGMVESSKRGEKRKVNEISPPPPLPPLPLLSTLSGILKDVLNEADEEKKAKKKKKIKKVDEANEAKKKEEAKKTCEHCGKTLADKYTYNRHVGLRERNGNSCMKPRNPDELYVTCRYPTCGKKLQKRSMNQHERDFHNEKKDKYPFKCKECGKGFGQPPTLDDHMNSKLHKNNRQYACANCGRRFTQSGQRNRHEETCDN